MLIAICLSFVIHNFQSSIYSFSEEEFYCWGDIFAHVF